VSASDFRQITLGGDTNKRERLFRAAVSAFCSLTRPSRRDISQLEDLTLPLFDSVSAEARRYVAAALSECPQPPSGLVRRLCDEPVEVAAPLLVRSNALADIDLIRLIGRHGLGHARVIARRPDLNPTIAQLVTAIERSAQKDIRRGEAAEKSPFQIPDARRRLRSMMLPSRTEDSRTEPAAVSWTRLRDAALTGLPALFHRTVADVLAIDCGTIRRIARRPSHAWLIAVLRALNLSEERAFLIAAAVVPAEFTGAASIQLFLGRYRSLAREDALERIADWATEVFAAGDGRTELSAATAATGGGTAYRLKTDPLR
jgi:uncharacterized protein (DUF2336 family)